MNRSKKCVFVSHCLLAQVVRAKGLVKVSPAIIKQVVQFCMDNDINVFQMPCPESLCAAGGLRREVHGKAWYEKNGLRETSSKIAKEQVNYMVELKESGFAVVATEVRNLAQRSASAAKEIKGLILESVVRVQNGSEMVENSVEAIADIVGSVQSVSKIIAEISASSQKQSAGIDRTSKAISRMDAMTQQNAALVDKSVAASHLMEEKALALHKLMDYFKISNHKFRLLDPDSVSEVKKGAKVIPLDAYLERETLFKQP